MTGPKRLWSGDWSDESAAAKARMAAQRAQRAALADAPTEPLAPPPPRRAAFGGARQLLATAALHWRRAAARVRALASARTRIVLVPRGLRARLIVIAVLAGIAGAAVTIGVEAATGATTPASQSSGRAWLGVQLGDAAGEPGALVEVVIPGTPAEAAGLEPGDVITSIDGSSIADGDAAAEAIAHERPGQQITLGIERVGQPLTITATLGTRPAKTP